MPTTGHAPAPRNIIPTTTAVLIWITSKQTGPTQRDTKSGGKELKTTTILFHKDPSTGQSTVGPSHQWQLEVGPTSKTATPSLFLKVRWAVFFPCPPHHTHTSPLLLSSNYSSCLLVLAMEHISKLFLPLSSSPPCSSMRSPSLCSLSNELVAKDITVRNLRFCDLGPV